MTAFIEKFGILMEFPIQDIGLVLISSLVFIYSCRIFLWVNPKFNRIYISVGLTLLSILLRLGFLYIYNNKLFFLVVWVYCICIVLLIFILIFMKVTPTFMKQFFSSRKITVLTTYLDLYIIASITAAELHIDAYKNNLLKRKDPIVRVSSILWPYGAIIVAVFSNIDFILDYHYLSLGIPPSQRPFADLSLIPDVLAILLGLDLLLNYLKLERGFETVDENWDQKIREVAHRYVPLTNPIPEEFGGGIPKVRTVENVAEYFSNTPGGRRWIVRTFYGIIAIGVAAFVGGIVYKTSKLPELHEQEMVLKKAAARAEEATVRAQEATVRAQEAAVRAQEQLAQESRLRQQYLERKMLEKINK